MTGAGGRGICDEAIAHINAHGYYIMRDAFPAPLCDEMLAAIARLEAAGAPLSLRNAFHGFKTTRFYDLLNHGEVWERAATLPEMLAVVRGVLGDDCLLNTYGTSIIGPGETAQPIHVDDGPFISAPNADALRHRPRLYDGGPRRSIVLNCNVALSDFTAAAGATRIVPDSNRLPYPRPADSARWMRESIPAEMPKGSVLFFEGQCYHAGGANVTSDERRFAVTIDFCAGFLRTQENFVLSCGAERAAAFPPELQRLIGLKMSRGGLGHVYNHSPTGAMRGVAMRNSFKFFDGADKGQGYSFDKGYGAPAPAGPSSRL